LRSIRSTSGRFASGVAVVAVAAGAVQACFDQLGPDPQFPSDAGIDSSNGSDGGTDGGPIFDAAADTQVSGPVALLSTTSIDFGAVGCGTAPSMTQSLSIENTGTEPLSFSVTLDNASAFSISPSAGGTVAVGQATQITVSGLRVPQTATAAQPIAGGLTIDSNDATHPTQSVHLSVTPTGGTVTITPQTIDFGQVPAGSPSVVPVAITNTGNAMVAVQFTTPSNGEFSLWAGATLANSLGPTQTLANANVTFTPANGGVSSAPMSIVGTTCGISPNEIDLVGQVSPSQFTEISATQLDFSTPCMGASVAQTVTITNESATDLLTISNVATTGGFAATPPTLSIAAGQSGTLSVTAPAWAAGTQSGPGGMGLLTFATSDGQLPNVSIALTETFVGADLAFTDSSDDTLATITYPGVPVGSAQTYPFQVLNTGNASVAITPGAVTSPPWSWAIPGAQIVPVNGFAPLSLTFSPTTSGVQSTMVTLVTSGAVCSAPGLFTATGTGTGGTPADGGSTLDASALDSSAPDSMIPNPDASSAGD
jgi:hypothetical protein